MLWRAGTPSEPSPKGWDDIPGARGCTPQSCSFRDTRAEFAAHGAAIIGISTQTPEEQREFAEREHIPYPLLSDHDLLLAEAMGLPTFETSGLHLYNRLAFVAEAGEIVKVFYPVFPPDPQRGRGPRLAGGPHRHRTLSHRIVDAVNDFVDDVHHVSDERR